MRERGDGLCLPLESLQCLGIGVEVARQNLEGHIAVELRVARPIHLAHAPCAEWAQDLVRAEVRARRETHETGEDYVAHETWAGLQV